MVVSDNVGTLLTRNQNMARIAFLGTGLLGSGLTEASAKRGDNVTAWNRTPEKANVLEQFGVRVAPTADQAVLGAERVHIVLKDDATVESVIRLMLETVERRLLAVLPSVAVRMDQLIAQGHGNLDASALGIGKSYRASIPES